MKVHTSLRSTPTALAVATGIVGIVILLVAVGRHKKNKLKPWQRDMGIKA